MLTKRRENENNAAKKEAANRYFEYAKASFDNLTSKATAFYASQKPAVPDEDITTSILNSRTVAEREAAANLIAFAQSNQVTCRNEEDGKISLLIDQLKANEPKNVPAPNDEISSLRALQKLIEQRISVLNPQCAAAPEDARSPEVQPTSTEQTAASPQ